MPTHTPTPTRTVRAARAPRPRPWRLEPLRLRRRPLLWWAASLVLVLTTAVVVSSAVTRAEAGAARFGTMRPVLVATRDIAPGEVVDLTAAEGQDLPAALVPSGAAEPGALGARATHPIHVGEVVHQRRLAPGGLSTVTALLPAGTRGIAVPTGTEALRLRVGDVVDVLATIPEQGPGSPPTVTVAADAVVVDVGEAAITVGVPVEQAPKVAYAVTTGLVTLTLVAR